MGNVTASEAVAPGGTRAAAWTSRSTDPSRTMVTPRTARRRSPVLATIRSADRRLGGPVKMRGSCCFSVLFAAALLAAGTLAAVTLAAVTLVGAVLPGAGAWRRAVAMPRRLEVDHETVGALGSHVSAGPTRHAQREQLQTQDRHAPGRLVWRADLRRRRWRELEPHTGVDGDRLQVEAGRGVDRGCRDHRLEVDRRGRGDGCQCQRGIGVQGVLAGQCGLRAACEGELHVVDPGQLGRDVG